MATVPTFTLTANTNYVDVTVTSSGSDSYVYVYRYLAGGTVYRLSATVPTGSNKTFSDYNAPFNTLLYYYCVAVDGSGGLASSVTKTTTLELSGGAYLHQVTKAAQTNLSGTILYLYNQSGQRRESMLAENVMVMPSRTAPVIEQGDILSKSFSVPIIIPHSLDANRATLETFFTAKETFNFRDKRGHQEFITFPSQQFSIDYNSTMNIVANRRSYDENVA